MQSQNFAVLTRAFVSKNPPQTNGACVSVSEMLNDHSPHACREPSISTLDPQLPVTLYEFQGRQQENQLTFAQRRTAWKQPVEERDVITAATPTRLQQECSLLEMCVVESSLE